MAHTSYAPGGSQYLQNPATKDLDMNSLSILFDSDSKIRSGGVGSNEIWIENIAETYYRDLRMRSLFMTGAMGGATAGGQVQMRPHWNKGEMLFPVYDSAAWENQIILGAQGAFTPCVRMPNLPTSDPADGLSRIWSDGGVLTLGT